MNKDKSARGGQARKKINKTSLSNAKEDKFVKREARKKQEEVGRKNRKTKQSVKDENSDSKKEQSANHKNLESGGDSINSDKKGKENKKAVSECKNLKNLNITSKIEHEAVTADGAAPLSKEQKHNIEIPDNQSNTKSQDDKPQVEQKLRSEDHLELLQVKEVLKESNSKHTLSEPLFSSGDGFKIKLVPNNTENKENVSSQTKKNKKNPTSPKIQNEELVTQKQYKGDNVLKKKNKQPKTKKPESQESESKEEKPKHSVDSKKCIQKDEENEKTEVVEQKNAKVTSATEIIGKTQTKENTETTTFTKDDNIKPQTELKRKRENTLAVKKALQAIISKAIENNSNGKSTIIPKTTLKQEDTSKLSVLQLKIVLCDITPPVWRRIQVLNSDTFLHLTNYIKQAMEWTTLYFCNFLVPNGSKKKSRVLIVHSTTTEKPKNALEQRNTKLSKFLCNTGDTVIFEYNFGDTWRFKIRVERILPHPARKTEYPKCTGGKRAGPPNGCGCVRGFQNLRVAYKDPKHSEYNELVVKWLGNNCPEWNPEKFDKKQLFKKH